MTCVAFTTLAYQWLQTNPLSHGMKTIPCSQRWLLMQMCQNQLETSTNQMILLLHYKHSKQEKHNSFLFLPPWMEHHVEQIAFNSKIQHVNQWLCYATNDFLQWKLTHSLLQCTKLNPLWIFFTSHLFSYMD